MDIVWDKEDTQPTIKWDDEPSTSVEPTQGDMAQGIVRALAGGGAGMAYGGVRAIDRLTSSGDVGRATQELEAGQQQVEHLMDKANFGTSPGARKAAEDLGKVFQWLNKTGGDVASFVARYGTVQGLYHEIKRDDPVAADEYERIARGMGEVGSNFLPLPGLAIKGRGVKAKAAAAVEPTEVAKFLEEKKAADAMDDVKRQIALDNRAKVETQVTDLVSIEKGRTNPDIQLEAGATPVDINVGERVAGAPRYDLFDFEDPAGATEQARAEAYSKLGETPQKDLFDQPVKPEDRGLLPSEAQTTMPKLPGKVEGTKIEPGLLDYEKPVEGIDLPRPEEAIPNMVEFVSKLADRPQSNLHKALKDAREAFDTQMAMLDEVGAKYADSIVNRAANGRFAQELNQTKKGAAEYKSALETLELQAEHGELSRQEVMKRLSEAEVKFRKQNRRPVTGTIEKALGEMKETSRAPKTFGNPEVAEPRSMGDTSAFDPFRKQPKVEKTMSAEDFRKALQGEQPTLGRTRKGSSQRGGAQKGVFSDSMETVFNAAGDLVRRRKAKAIDPELAKLREGLKEDPITGAAFADASTGDIVGPFLNHHSHGFGWLDRARKEGVMKTPWEALRPGFITKSGKFLTREEAQRLTGADAGISEVLNSGWTQQEPQIIKGQRPDVGHVNPAKDPGLTGQVDPNAKLSPATLAVLRKALGKSQVGALDVGAVLDGIKSLMEGPKKMPEKSDFANFREQLPPEFKDRAKELYDEFKTQQARKQRDAVRSDPVAAGVTQPGMFEGLKRYVPFVRSVEEILPQLKGKDVDGGVWGKIKQSGVAGGKLYSQISQNPLVKVGVDIVNAAVRARETAALKSLFDKDAGILTRFNALKKAEREQIWAVMRKYNGKRWLNTDDLIREGLNDKQIQAYTNYRTEIGKALNDLNIARAAKGLDPVKAVEGYVPARWVGRYYIRIADKDGRLLSVEARRGKAEVEKLKAHLEGQKEKGYQVSEVLTREDIRQTKRPGEARTSRDLFDQIAETLGRDSLEKAVLDQLVEDYQAQLPGGRKGFGKHMEEKTGVGGYLGDMEGRTPHEHFLDAMEGIDGYVRDLYDFVETQKAHSEIAKLTKKDNGVDMPNAKSYVEAYWNHAQKMEGQFAQTQRHVLEAIPKSFGLDPALVSKLSNGIRKQVVLSMLGYWRPSFLASQVFQPVTMMLPALTEMRIRAHGEQFTHSTPVAMARGWADAWHPEGASALSKEAYKWAKDNGVLRDTLMSDLDSLKGMEEKTFIGETWKYVNGEKPMQMAENFARRAAFMQAVYALEGSKLPKAERFAAAGDIMDMAMTNYAHHEKAMGFTAGGELGKWVSPLQTYKMNWVSQRLKYARLIAEDFKNFDNYKPLAQSIVMDLLFAGVMGTMLLKEADLAISLLKKMGVMDADTDDATGHLLKWSDQIAGKGKGRDFLRYGVLSGITGYDFSPQYAMSQLVPHSMADLFPTVKKASDIGKAAMGVAMDPMNSERQGAALNQLPGPAKALGEMAMRDENGMLPNPNRNMEGKVRREGFPLGTAMGAGAINEKEQTQAVFQNVQQEQQIAEAKKGLLDVMKEKHADGRPIDDEMSKFMQYGGTPSEIINALKQDQMNRNTTAYERATKAPTNNNQRRQVLRMQDYGVRE